MQRPAREPRATSSGSHASPATGAASASWRRRWSGSRRSSPRGDLPDHALLLSGQDYPLAAPREIDALPRGPPRPQPAAPLPPARGEWAGEGGGLNRLRYPYFERIRYKTRLLRLPIPRRLPAGLEPYGGMALWALTGETLEWLMRFVAERPDVLRFFERTKMPDETFFQTLI